MRFISALCSGKEALKIPPPPLEELAALIYAAPPMPGGEYLRAEILLQSWRDLQEQAATIMLDELSSNLRELTGRGRYRAWAVMWVSSGDRTAFHRRVQYSLLPSLDAWLSLRDGLRKKVACR